MEKVGVSGSLMSRYHPQANDQVEQANQKKGFFLRTFCSETPTPQTHLQEMTDIGGVRASVE